jgi:nucleotide-binding universal stress UspA family protein
VPSPTTIVCAVDGSGRAHHVARVSRQLAEAADAQVVLTHVFDPMMVPAPPTRELDLSLSTEDIEQHERRLARHALARTAESLGDVAYAAVFAEGRPEPEILGVVDDYDARLLVTGSAALTPVERIMGGSLSAQLAVAARCPVVVVTDDAAMHGAGPVLAAYDGSDHSLRAARHGAALAARLGRNLVLMHVAAPDEPGAQADAALAREMHAAARACADATRGAAQRLDVTLAVEHGDPVEQLSLAADERAAPLIVVGSRGRNALKAALLGSVSAGVVRRADRPVVVAGPHAEEPLVASAT